MSKQNVQYFTPFATALTLCVITLENGHSVVGQYQGSAENAADLAHADAVNHFNTLNAFINKEAEHQKHLAELAAAAAGVTEENKKVRKPRVKKEDAVTVLEQAEAATPAEAVAPAKPRRQRKAA